MLRKSRIDNAGIIMLTLFSAMLGLNQALVKLVNAGFSPIFQAGLRSVCAFFIVLSFALIFKKKLSLSDGSLLPGLAIGVLFTAEFFLLFTALDYTTVSRVSLFFYTQPFWVALGAHFLITGEQLNRNRIMGLLIAISGIALCLFSDAERASLETLKGDVMCLVAAVFWAIIALMPRTTKISLSTPEMQLLYQLAVSAIILTSVAPLLEDPIRNLTPVILAIFSFQVIFVVSIGFIFWFWAISVYPASDMASFSLLSPLFGVFFGWIIFSDELTAEFIVALLMVISGIVLSNRKVSATG
ncbi:MAG: DMT family transporter [Gammaproteobacteria bacterium]|nr:DMT family transporter [Gammaproteobacteria bacterium]MBT6247444.1 DMT family transporter [Gammaproteobacteria bacterium]